MQKKRMAAAIMTAVLALSSLSASAEWVSAGYDTSVEFYPNSYRKIYNEVIDGNYTSKVKTEALPQTAIEWKAEDYELAYPHAGYDRLYLEGNAQEITRYNNLFPQWETRFADCFWEMYGNHRIYQRQQTKIPGKGWTWDYSDDEWVDSTLFVPTTRNELNVTVSHEHYGVGPFDMKGKYVSEEVAAMYARFGVDNEIFVLDAKDPKEIAEGTFFHADNLSARNMYGEYVVTDEWIAENAGSIVSKFYTGPNYNGATVTKDAAAEYLVHGDAWAWDWDVVKYGCAHVDWTKPTYEMAEPYNMYQYLIINGLVFDGRADLPRIYRYTGGKATPNVEWKYAFAEADAPYNVVEFKYIDGKLAYENGEPVYRYPTGEYANIYVKTTDKEIQLWLKDDVADVKLDSFARTYTEGYYGGYMGSANYVFN